MSEGIKTLARVEMEYILERYAANNFNKTQTALDLGISLKTLYNKLHSYDVLGLTDETVRTTIRHMNLATVCKVHFDNPSGDQS